MATTTTEISPPATIRASSSGNEVPFGVNAIRLTSRQWLTTLAIVLGCTTGLPLLWKHVEWFEIEPDYRIPYTLSKDYWLYQRRLERIVDQQSVPVLGDSVIWGEYVRPNGTLTHFLNRATGQADRFVNCGVNGLFPLALEGLVEYYGPTLRNRKLIVHCNMLWMSSRKADLSVKNEQDFNHAQLVPQFFPRIPCYRADTAERLGAVIGRRVACFAWVDHLNNVYFNQRSIPLWTLEEEEGSVPPCYPNAWRNPLAQITGAVPSAPGDDPQRGPASPRHKPWNSGGTGPVRFDWVPLDTSLQWRGFQRLIELLRSRGNDVLVILGPFNEPMMAEDQRAAFVRQRDGIVAWLVAQRVVHVVPEPLPSHLYADASHPLTDGYAMLAQRLCDAPAFQRWLEK